MAMQMRMCSLIVAAAGPVVIAGQSTVGRAHNLAWKSADSIYRFAVRLATRVPPPFSPNLIFEARKE
jgi:hypothetical protein